MEKKLIKINILKLPKCTSFHIKNFISFYGLLCEHIYNDNSKEYVIDDILIYDHFIDKVGTYSCKVMAKEDPNIFTKFEFTVHNNNN